MTEPPSEEANELEALLAAAVARVLDETTISETAARQLSEATSLVLQAFLREEAGTWPSDGFVDGLMPLSIEGSEGRRLEMAAATIVTHGERCVVEPLLVRFAIDGDQVLDFAILFADSGREAEAFTPEFDYSTLHFPVAEDTWRFRFGVDGDQP